MVAGRRQGEIVALIEAAAPRRLTVREMADALGIAPQGATCHLRPLAAEGRIDVRRVPADREAWR